MKAANLISAERYHYKGVLFTKGHPVKVEDEVAEYLATVRTTDGHDKPMFEIGPVGKVTLKKKTEEAEAEDTGVEI